MPLMRPPSRDGLDSPMLRDVNVDMVDFFLTRGFTLAESQPKELLSLPPDFDDFVVDDSEAP